MSLARQMIGSLIAVCGMIFAPNSTWADQFELLDGPTLKRLLSGPEVTPRLDLSLSEVGVMPAWLVDSRSALVVARTDSGNLTRLLLVPELRKPPNGAPGEPIPVMVVERLDTFDAGDLATRTASRRDVVLFDGMPLDLDTGQVVPVGQGGDLVFRTSHDEPNLEVIAPAQLYGLTKAPEFAPSVNPRPSPGRSILPSDFAGRYRLFANGQWSGTLDLTLEGRGAITGQFRSDLHGTNYPVTGQVAADAPGLIRFSIALPRARQEFDGYLYGEGKGAMAGTLTLLDRTFGFFAVREGGRYAPEGRDLGTLQDFDHNRPGQIRLDLAENGSIRLDGRPVPLDKLADTLRTEANLVGDPLPWILIQASDEVKFAQLTPIIAAVRTAGLGLIRFDFPVTAGAGR